MWKHQCLDRLRYKCLIGVQEKCCISYINFMFVTGTILRADIGICVLQYQIYDLKQTGIYFSSIFKQGIILLCCSKCFVENNYASRFWVAIGRWYYVHFAFLIKVVISIEVMYINLCGTGCEKYFHCYPTNGSNSHKCRSHHCVPLSKAFSMTACGPFCKGTW